LNASDDDKAQLHLQQQQQLHHHHHHHHVNTNAYTETAMEKILQCESGKSSEMSLLDKIRLFDRNNGMNGNPIDGEFFSKNQLKSTSIVHDHPSPTKTANNNDTPPIDPLGMYNGRADVKPVVEKHVEPNDFIDKCATNTKDDSVSDAVANNSQVAKTTTTQFKAEPNDACEKDMDNDDADPASYIKAAYRTATQSSSSPLGSPSSQSILRHDLYHHTTTPAESHYQSKALVIASQD
jgi:hypothetical protein